MIGGSPGKQNLRCVQGQLQLAIGHAGQLIPDEDPRMLSAKQSDLLADAQGRDRMIAGHHDYADACGVAARQCCGHFRPRRISQPDQPRQD